ncbi:hypothetical protein TRFO_06137 [Tritrichomonas foetus]|uniref:Uncharacterized protein n=1 Tax=Tritrichomonas foetus TaxID=1144522 RepID=A0A1J4K4W0_9EUKA|nr:hypothetical protein TRFO_06137 [Tritrichomonas foetus]|eukprot:OHT04718.1 hypothetical protein TRFO_06137 [Tritrichomonas foetus]
MYTSFKIQSLKEIQYLFFFFLRRKSFNIFFYYIVESRFFIRMLAFFSSLIILTQSAVIPQIYVCDTKCPSHATGFQIIYNNTMDLAQEIHRYMTDRSYIYFYTAGRESVDFNLKIHGWNGNNAEFKKLDGSKTVDLIMDIEDLTETPELTFTDLDVIFSSTTSKLNVEIDSVSFIDTNIDFRNVSPNLLTQKLVTDDSIKSFSRVTIEKKTYYGSYVEFDITSHQDVTALVSDKQVDVILEGKTTQICFQDETEMDMMFNMASDSTFYVNYTGKTASLTPSLQFENIQNCVFSGNWPDSLTFPFEDKRLGDTVEYIYITSYSSVLPLTIKGTATYLIQFNEKTTTITGNIAASLKFGLARTTFLEETNVVVKGKFTGDSIDLGSSYIRATIENIDIDFDYGTTFPFIFRVGTGGASTLTFNKAEADSTSFYEIQVSPDFTSFLSDAELKTLLDNEWKILELPGMNLIAHVEAILPDSPFIHGFTKHDSVIHIEKNLHHYDLTATSPSAAPLKLCYDGPDSTCDDGKSGHEIHDIQLLSEYFVVGMKYMELTLKYFVNNIDLSFFDYGFEGCTVKITGTSHTSVDSLSLGSQKGISYMELSQLNFQGRTDFHIKDIKFSKCVATQYSSLVFHNDDRVTGDDEFVRTMIPQVIGDIGNFTYIMDFYDSMSLDDEEYVFYDLDTNDISDPISIPYSLLGDFHILYDVGMSSSATENNLNVTINTKQPKAFNLTFDRLTYDYRTEAELILYNWQSIKTVSDFHVNFDHGPYPIKIVLTEPYNPVDNSQITVTGSGKITYVDRYNNTQSYCACEGDNCQRICPKDASQIKYSEVSTKITDSQFDNFTIYIGSSTSGSHPTFPLDKADLKAINFVGLSQTTLDLITITNESGKSIDMELTSTLFTNLSVSTTSSSTKMFFGTLQFTNCSIDSGFKNVEITVDDFFTDFETLKLFKKVTITDNCYVTGEPFTDEDITVDFIPDENANDLQVTVVSDMRITMGDGYAKFGRTKFNIPRTRIYDIVINVNVMEQIEILKDSTATDSKIPLVLFKTCTNANVRFGDGWDQSSTDFIFLFDDINGSTITLTGPNTPVAISVIAGDFNLVANEENVGINGFIEYRGAQEAHDIHVRTTVQKKNVTIKVAKVFDIGRGMNIFFNQPNIVLDLYEVEGSILDGEALLSVEHYSDVDGDTKIIIHNPLDKALLNTNYKVACTVSDPLTQADVAAYVKKEHVLFQVNPVDASKCKQTSLTYLGQEPTTHGFNGNQAMQANNINGYITLSFIKQPEEVPWTVCYKTTSKCEVQVDEGTISNLDQYIPSGSKFMTCRMGSSNTNNLRLDFSSFKGIQVEIVSTSTGAASVNALFGSGIVKSLNLSNVKVSTTESAFKVDQLRLTNGATINKLDGFDDLTVDYDTWKQGAISKFSNNLTLLYSSNKLTFTENGWKLDDEKEIKVTDFPKFALNFQSGVALQFDAEKELSTVRALKIISISRKFVIGENFDSIVSPVIEFENRYDPSLYTVTASSYPFVIFPTLMNASTLNLATLPYTTSSTMHFTDINSTIDFSNKAGSSGRFTAPKIIFRGKSSLAAKLSDTVYPITITDGVEAHDDALVTLNNAKVNGEIRLNGDATLSGHFDVPSAKIVYEWQLNQIPDIAFTSDPESQPSSVVFKFIDQTLEGKEEEYNNYLYNKAYALASGLDSGTCQKWLDKLTLESSYKYFNSEDPVFDFNCNGNNLIVIGRRLIPVIEPTDESKDHKLSPGAIAGISITVILVVAGLAVAGFILYRRNAFSRLTTLLNSERLNSNNEQYMNNPNVV